MFHDSMMGAEYFADGELGVVGFSHGVVDEGRHQFSDLVQIIGPELLRDEEVQSRKVRTSPLNLWSTPGFDPGSSFISILH